jgi:hypothetical protein
LNPPAGVAPTNIPRQYVEAIARAFQQSAAAKAIKQELSELMQTPFSFEEFLKALSHGGNLSPGESGVSYRLLQVAPEVVQRKIFALLQNFWNQDCTPEQWKRVVLILIHAEKPAMFGNFRSIGLLEVLRKV